MYLRPVHSTFHLPILYSFIRANPLGVLTSAIANDEHALIQSTHLPWVLDVPPNESTSNEADASTPHDITGELDALVRATSGQPLGILRAHLSRANPHAKVLISAAQAQAEATGAASTADSTAEGNERRPLPEGGVTLPDEVLILFTGPIQHYVTPKFYTATKPTTGKVVPTWNYEAVQAYGRITVYPSTTSAAAEAFLSTAIADLSHQSELTLGFDGQQSRPKEWLVDDAPDRFIGLLKKSIVGVSVEITRLGGKFKMSQELGEADRRGVIEGFEGMGNQGMAESVAQWGAAKAKSAA